MTTRCSDFEHVPIPTHHVQREGTGVVRYAGSHWLVAPAGNDVLLALVRSRVSQVAEFVIIAEGFTRDASLGAV
jgi:hypothetical protein